MDVTRSDALDGMVDFFYFASAGVVLLGQREPAYVKSNEQLRVAFAVLAEDTVRLLGEGRAIDRFRGFHYQELFDHFRTAAENEHIRRYLRGWLGPEWCGRVLGI